MKKFLGASLVLVLVVGLPSAIFFRNDPASLRAVIEEEARNEAGVGLDIQGEMRWKWMPFGLEARDVLIRLPGPGGERNMHAEAVIFEADPAELVWNGLRFSGLEHIKAISLKALEGLMASGTREEDASVALKQADIRLERVAFEQPMRVRGRYQVESTAGWFGGAYAFSASLWVGQGFERLEMRDVQLQGTPASNNPLAFLGRNDLNIEHLVWIDGLPVSIETIRGDWELGVSMSSERIEAGFAINHGDRPMTALEKELGFRFETLTDGQSPQFRVNGNMQVLVDRMDLLMQSTGWMSDAYDYSRFPRKVDADFGLSLFEGTMRIEPLTLVSGEDRLSGSLIWQPSSARALTFDLGIQHLDLMRWIPRGASDLVPDGQASERFDDAVVSDESVPWHALGGRGVVRAAQIKVGDTVFSEASALVEIEKSVLEMKGAHARIDEAGVLELDATVDLKGNASGSLALVSRSAPLLPYLKILGLDQGLHGQGDLEARLFVQGLDRVSWRRSLRGDVSVRLPEGTLKGLNPAARICQAVSFVEEGHSPAIGSVSEPVPFTGLEAGFAFSQGVSSGSSVSFMTENAQTMGIGDVDLLQRKYAWQLEIRHHPSDTADPVGVADTVEVAESQVCDMDTRYASMSWPMKCQGDFGPKNMAACGFDQVVLDDRRAAVLEDRKVAAQALLLKTQAELPEKIDADTPEASSRKVHQAVTTLPVDSTGPLNKPAVKERPAPKPPVSSSPSPAQPAAPKTVQVKKTVQGYEVNGKVFPSRAAASEEARWESFRQKFREGKHR